MSPINITLQLFDSKCFNNLIVIEKGSLKFGEKIERPKNSKYLNKVLEQSKARFVLLGIKDLLSCQNPEKKVKTKNTFDALFKNLLNTQYNTFNKSNSLLALGTICIEESEDDDNSINNKAGINYIEEIDKNITHIIYQIIKSGKKPIIVSDYQYANYGIIKGCALGYNKSINVLNVDNQPDFKPTNYRHHENGFRLAFKEGFMDRYCGFGLHLNKIDRQSLLWMNKFPEQLHFISFKDILMSKLKKQLRICLEPIAAKPFGIEIDCKSINPLSFSTNDIRTILAIAKQEKNMKFLHITEANNTTDKSFSLKNMATLFICDFINK